jgi:hypothetical protein
VDALARTKYEYRGTAPAGQIPAAVIDTGSPVVAVAGAFAESEVHGVRALTTTVTAVCTWGTV